MQHSTSWLNCSRAYRRSLLSIAARGPTEAEARAAKAQREADRRAGKNVVIPPGSLAMVEISGVVTV
jgi:hypothetical protein